MKYVENTQSISDAKVSFKIFYTLYFFCLLLERKDAG